MYVIVVYILALYLPLYQGHCHLKWENDHIVNIQNGSKLKQRGVLKQVITQYIWVFFSKITWWINKLGLSLPFWLGRTAA